MRLARKLPPVRPLSGLVVHLCGRCTSEPVSVSPSRHHRNGFNRNVAHDIPCFVPALGSANDLRAARSCLDQRLKLPFFGFAHRKNLMPYCGQPLSVAAKQMTFVHRSNIIRFS